MNNEERIAKLEKDVAELREVGAVVPLLVFSTSEQIAKLEKNVAELREVIKITTTSAANSLEKLQNIFNEHIRRHNENSYY